MSTPTRRARSGCCACAVSGQAAAALPSSETNSRRFMWEALNLCEHYLATEGTPCPCGKAEIFWTSILVGAVEAPHPRLGCMAWSCCCLERPYSSPPALSVLPADLSELCGICDDRFVST